MLLKLTTPLRYPGGKSKITQQLNRYFPSLHQVKEYREPFLGGGGMALDVARRYPDLDIWVNDAYTPLSVFWQQLQRFPQLLIEKLLDLKQAVKDEDGHRQLFEDKKIELRTTDDPLKMAVAFFTVNRLSFSGLTEQSSYADASRTLHFNERAIWKLDEASRLIRNWRITNTDYRHLLDGGDEVFLYLDPPYAIDCNLYGRNGDQHRGFDHRAFAEACKASDCQQLVSYNAQQNIVDLFKGYNNTRFELTYTMQSKGNYREQQKTRDELLLFNYPDPTNCADLGEFFV